jgi:DNA-binding NarL/FixJ family response regulator
MIANNRRNLPRILIADDHTLVAEACRKLLEPDYEVVATVSDGRALVRAVPELKPHLIVVDVAMPLLNGLDAGQQARELLPSVRLIFLTMNHDADVAAEAFRRGASGYLVKSCAASELTTAVREVLRGKSYLSPMIAKDTVDFLLRQDKKLVDEGDRLTERQREVLQLLAEGKCMKEVGAVLNLTTRTIAFHKYRIMEVLNVRTTAELVQYAIRNHLIPA